MTEKESYAMQLLEDLAGAYARLDLLRAEIAAARNKVLTPEIKMQLAAIDAEYEDKIAFAQDSIKQAEADAKAGALAVGATVKGSRYQAVYTKGRVQWDAKALDGYALNVPELFAFRKEGEPSISLRAVKS